MSTLRGRLDGPTILILVGIALFLVAVTVFFAGLK